MTETNTDLAAIHAELDLLRLHLADARHGEAVALAAVAMLHQQAAAFSDDMDAANEPDPDPQPRVMPAQALRRQHAPGGLWTPDV